MSERRRLDPGPDHSVTVRPTGHLVTATVQGRRVAASEHAATLRDAGYAPVVYFPVADVDPGVLRVSTTTSYCPYKGDPGYVHVALPDGVAGDPSDGRHVVNDAGWFYPIPYKPVADIAGHIAFYPDSVQITAHDPVDDLDWTDRSVRSPDVDHD
jgi:uncharacterized protein (DUF427 family)